MNLYSICSSCQHEDYCSMQKNSVSNIIQCEEFQLAPYLNGKQVPKAEKYICNDAPGLCKNCSNFENCILKTSCHVIWHCEEFAI